MKTIELNKKAIVELKKDIKKAAEKQKFYKNQRKTKKLVGERKLAPSEATWKHQINRAELRKMYAAYAKLRGKDISKIDSLKFIDSYEEKGFYNELNTLIEVYNEV